MEELEEELKSGGETDETNGFQSGTRSFTESLDSDTTGGSDGDTDPLEASLSILDQAAETVTETMPEENQEDAQDTFETAKGVVKQEIEQRDRKIDFFRSAFSVNQLMFGFSHELRGMINNLNVNAMSIENRLDSLPPEERSEFKSVASDLREMQERFEQQMELFGIFMNDGETQHPDDHDVQDKFSELSETLQYIADFYQVEITSDFPPVFETPEMFESELHSILINLLINAIKAIGAADTEGGTVHVTGENTEDGISIRVCDDGIGISDEAKNEAFDALVSDPEDELYRKLNKQMPDEFESQLGSGSGLGLNIVKNISRKYNGHTRFVEDDEWETCVEVTLNE
ncbi:HAMP domain-containing sensor histidine kinase [Halorubrum ezzemoulense]|uniref:sensor histidine kinase n=1 Tax=Halorubrum ezzemoulense TaxID=337243 RepID=UPI00232A8C11|nr:HAMP domain-containing sensor histidine kinase [Halorubrum ezzemoulense]MDB2272848.1 HAMP domain-containing sensor histidine kinase [Halorubrum ezzemoulense]